MAKHGAIGRVLPVVRGTRTLTITAFLRNMEPGCTHGPGRPHGPRAVAPCREVRRWARRPPDGFDRPVEPEFEIEWRAFRLAG